MLTRLQLLLPCARMHTAGLCVWSRQFVCVCMYVCICGQINRLFGVLPPENLPLVQSTARSSSLTTKKGAYYARRFVLGKKFGTILLTGWKKVLENCITVSHSLYCKVAGRNLTCRDDWKTRWRLHSVDLTSTGLSSLDQNIIHSPLARVVYGWWGLHISLQECHNGLKTCSIVQYGVSESVSTKTPFFLRCLTLSGWFECIGILYTSIRVGSNL